MNTLTGEATLSFSVLSPLSVGSALERICSSRSKFYPLTLLHSELPKCYRVLAILSAIGLRADPISEGLHQPRKQCGSDKSCLPLKS